MRNDTFSPDSSLPALLLPWFSQNARALPWRRDTEPYHIWLSEIMLQQTRVEAVKLFYERFLTALPSIAALAEAPEEQLYKLWEGLGYYSRVRNLQKAAQIIMSAYGGRFPDRYEAILALPGIGDYTAGAIGSICFGWPTPAVDGNVLRVLTRICDSSAPIDRPETKRAVSAALSAVYPAGRCGDFTQALMELGATVCVPNSSPRCAECPAAEICLARIRGTAALLPVKAKKKPRRVEEKTVFVLSCGSHTAVCKRPKGGLLGGLWEYPNVPGHLTPQAALDQAAAWGLSPAGTLRAIERKHIFTHIEWHMRCYYIPCRLESRGFQWFSREAFSKELALPTAFRMFQEDFAKAHD